MQKVLLSLVIAIGSLTAVVQGQTLLRVGEVNATPGSKVLVPIHIDPLNNVSALQFTLEFDPETLTIADDPPLPGSSIVDHVVGVGRYEGSVTLVIFSASLSTFKAGSGALVSMMFEVDGSAAGGSSVPLSLTAEEGADSEGDFVNILGVDGRIEIGSEDNLPAEGQNELIFPQIANGSFQGGSISVLMVFVNRTETTSNGIVRFFKSDGSPFTLKLTDSREDSGFDFSVAPGGSIVLITDGSGDLSAGYARLTSTAPLGGTLVFTTRDQNETPLAEAGVGASPVGLRFSVPVLYRRGNSNTGIAIVNVSEESTQLTLVLKDQSGSELGQRPITLATGEHLPRFATELFGSLALEEEFEGSIEVWSPVAISAVALKTEGDLLTTFPVIPLP